MKRQIIRGLLGIRSTDRFGTRVQTLLAQVIIAVLAGGAGFMAPQTADFWFLLGIIVLAVLLSLTQLLYRATGSRPVNWLTLDIIFLFTFLLIHLGYVFIYVTGVIPLRGDYLWHYKSLDVEHRVCQCSAYAVAVISAFLIGYNLGAEHFARPIVLANIPVAVRDRWSFAGKALVRIGFLLFVGFVVIAGPSVFAGLYRGSNFGVLANMFYDLARGSMAAGCAAIVISKAKYKGTWPVRIADTILILVSISAILIHGDRSSFLIIAVVVFATYAEFVKPFTIQRLVVATIVVSILIGISKSARVSGNRSLTNFVQEGQRRWSEGIATSALNFSASTLNLWVAAEHTERQHGYYFGEMQVAHIAGIVPFSRTALGLTGKNTSGLIFTELIQGKLKKGVSGTGTTAMADLYLDFGFLGTVLAFLIVGRYCKFVEQKSRSSSSIVWAVHYCLMLGIFSTIARYAILGSFVRQVLYPTIFMVLVLYFMRVPSRIRLRSPASRAGLGVRFQGSLPSPPVPIERS